MPISPTMKKIYNERYREKIRKLKEEKEKKVTEEKVNDKPQQVETKPDFFLNLRNKIIETSIMAAFPILLKVIHHHFSKRQLQVESKVESQPSENTASNPLNNLQMSHNF